MRSMTVKNNNNLFHQAHPPYDEIKKIIDKSKVVLVVSHIEPDGDALGTQLAFAAYLRQKNKQVILVRDSAIPEKYSFLENVSDIPHFEDLKEIPPIDTAIILECPNSNRIGNAEAWLTENVQVINIDHHRDNDHYGHLNWINNEASSVGEMVYEFFEKVQHDIDEATAEQLYVAIMTDTGRFRYKSTSPRTFEIAGKLVAAGAKTQKTCDEVYFNIKPSSMKLIGKVLNGIEFHQNHKICLLTLTKEMLETSKAEMSESDGLVDYTLFNKGVIVGALLKEINDNCTKISMRSSDGINVAQIAATFGGGGHFNASGCIVELPLQKAKEKILTLFTEALDAKK